jgi:hypothetical protein
MLIETATFRPVEGTDDDALLAADYRCQTEFANVQPGLVRRTTARSEDEPGGWLVLTFWRSAADADAADAAASNDPAASAFAALVDPASLTRRRYTTLD